MTPAIQFRSSLGDLARRYARAVLEKDPHRDARGLDLAEAVIAEVPAAHAALSAGRGGA